MQVGTGPAISLVQQIEEVTMKTTALLFVSAAAIMLSTTGCAGEVCEVQGDEIVCPEDTDEEAVGQVEQAVGGTYRCSKTTSDKLTANGQMFTETTSCTNLATGETTTTQIVVYGDGDDVYEHTCVTVTNGDGDVTLRQCTDNQS
jgi:hypothetical protein